MLAAVAMTALLLAAGLAIDMGYFRYQRRKMQTAADSAAIAGASAIPYCGSGANMCPAVVSAAQDDASNNGFTDGSNGTTVTPTNPTTGPYAGTQSVQVVVSQPQPTFFMKIAGILSSNVSATAVAHLGNGPGCIYALGAGGVGGPSSLIPTFITADCAVFSTGAINLPTSSDFLHNTTENGEGSSCQGGGCYAYDGHGGISPYPPQTIVPPADPLAYVPKPPDPGSCGGGMPQTFSTGTVPAGSYPCGISVVGPGPVTFDGTYSLGATNASAPALLVDATVVVQSGPDGATFYNNTGTISLIPDPKNNVGTIELAAPNSGTYAGILFYQDASDTRSATFGLYNGGTTGPDSYLQGALYFPTASIILDGFPYYNPSPIPNAPAQYTILVGYQVVVEGSIIINDNYSSLTNGSPIKAAVLVQ